MIQKHKFSASSGFTLVELLVIIGIVGILTGLLVQGVSLVRARADQSEALSNLRQLFMATSNYTADNKGRILSNRYQNPSGPGGPGFFVDWRQYLVDEGYVDAPDNLAKNNKIFGNPAVYKKHPDCGLATFAMNQRVGYRNNPASWHGVGTLFQLVDPSQTFFLTDGKYIEGLPDISFTDVVFPAPSPELHAYGITPSANNQVCILFFDGRAILLRMNQVPDNEAWNTDNRVFWRGFRTTL